MAAISVIVPIYKVEAFLHRCVDSILAQTFADFDLVLVDDGSPDSCGDICEEYARKDGRIHVIHQKNGGLSAARNTGIDWAQANSSSQWFGAKSEAATAMPTNADENATWRMSIGKPKRTPKIAIPPSRKPKMRLPDSAPRFSPM